MLATIIGTQLLQRPFPKITASPIMPEEFGEHLIRDQRPFSSYIISPDPSDSQLYVSTSSLQFTSLIFCMVQVRGQGQPWLKINVVLSYPFLYF